MFLFTTRLCHGLLLFLLLLTGCFDGPRTCYRTSDNRTLPSNWNSRFGPVGQLGAVQRLDQNNLYEMEFEGRWSWYRFWPDGQVIYRGSLNHPPTAVEADDFSWGDAGHYRIIGDELQMEFLRGRELWGGCVYWRHDAHIQSGGTLWVQGQDSLNGIVYSPRVVPGMKRQPDWPAK